MRCTPPVWETHTHTRESLLIVQSSSQASLTNILQFAVQLHTDCALTNITRRYGNKQLTDNTRDDDAHPVWMTVNSQLLLLVLLLIIIGFKIVRDYTDRQTNKQTNIFFPPQLCCSWLLFWNVLRKWVSCVLNMEGFVADGVSAPLSGRCAFYVAKKKRYCKMIVGSGKTFCGEHANAVCGWKYVILAMLCYPWMDALLLNLSYSY